MSEIVKKFYEIKEGSIEDNVFSGVANVSGIIDRGRDVVFPGCWKSCLASFLKSGFGALGHDWEGLPIFMPIDAKEEGQILHLKGEFHSTDDAQKARTVCQERMSKGLSVGLSVGFLPDYRKVMYFENGSKLLKYAEDNGYDMSLFDTKTIGKDKDMLRAIPEAKSLFEISLVTVPMNQDSNLTEVRSYSKSFMSMFESINPKTVDPDTLKSLESFRDSINSFLANVSPPVKEEDAELEKSENMKLRVLRARTKHVEQFLVRTVNNHE